MARQSGDRERGREHRPATFKYPVWSLAGDFRMWSHMVRGKLWKGDPLEELGLEEAGDRANGHAATV